MPCLVSFAWIPLPPGDLASSRFLLLSIPCRISVCPPLPGRDAKRCFLAGVRRAVMVVGRRPASMPLRRPQPCDHDDGGSRGNADQRVEEHVDRDVEKPLAQPLPPCRPSRHHRAVAARRFPRSPASDGERGRIKSGSAAERCASPGAGAPAAACLFPVSRRHHPECRYRSSRSCGRMAAAVTVPGSPAYVNSTCGIPTGTVNGPLPGAGPGREIPRSAARWHPCSERREGPPRPCRDAAAEHGCQEARWFAAVREHCSASRDPQRQERWTSVLLTGQ